MIDFDVLRGPPFVGGNASTTPPDVLLDSKEAPVVPRRGSGGRTVKYVGGNFVTYVPE